MRHRDTVKLYTMPECEHLFSLHTIFNMNLQGINYLKEKRDETFFHYYGKITGKGSFKIKTPL